MSPFPASSPSGQQGGTRYPLLQFEAVWRRTRLVLYYSVVVVGVAIGISYFEHHEIQSQFVILGVAVLALALLLQLGSGRHYVAVEPDGLRIAGLIRSEMISFGAMRQLRLQRLEVFFGAASRRNRMDRSLRAFRQTQACLVRLDLDPSEVYRLGRLLGRGTALDHDLIFIVSRADDLERSLLPRLRGNSTDRGTQASIRRKSPPGSRLPPP
ncbi:MAG: hypothetical protein WAL64_10680 [Candidatus Dormiibacterota bacterium]